MPIASQRARRGPGGAAEGSKASEAHHRHTSGKKATGQTYATCMWCGDWAKMYGATPKASPPTNDHSRSHAESRAVR